MSFRVVSYNPFIVRYYGENGERKDVSYPKNLTKKQIQEEAENVSFDTLDFITTGLLPPDTEEVYY